MKATIVAVGSELLGTERLDTNSLRLTAELERHGVELVRKSVIGDDQERLAAELRDALATSDLALVTGGLGPTADDVTRAAAAAALGRPIELREELAEEIRRRFAAMGLEMPAVNRRQAEVIEGATVLDNDRGTAPGLQLEEGGAHLFLFPGVPVELEGMIERYLVPWLRRVAGEAEIEQGVLRVACVPESTLEERIAPAYGEFGREAITVLARPGDIQVRFRAVGRPPERRARLQKMEARLAELIGRAVYSNRPDASLEEVVGERLIEAGRRVATAESCTGGLVAERLTRVAGSSAYFVGGVVAYSNELKQSLLEVPAELIERHGAVSEEVARAMAAGARRRLGADYAVSLTGVAGPGGGTKEKPVGTVHIAIAGPDEEVHRRIAYPGDRRRVRLLASQVALELLRRQLS